MGEVDTSGAKEEKRHPIFIQDFVDIDAPFKTMRERFTGDSEWLGPVANAAAQDGETMRMRIGPTWAAGLITREVRVMLGPPRERNDALYRSITWKASGMASLFPLLDGDIELAPVGPGNCRVSVDVIYTPPLGGFGARMDRALMHRVAASTVRSFISRIATKLQPESSESATKGTPMSEW